MHTYTRQRVHRAYHRGCKDCASLPLAPTTLRFCRSFWSGIYARFDGKRQRNSDATQDNFWFTASSGRSCRPPYIARRSVLRRIFEMETHLSLLSPTLRANAIAFQWTFVRRNSKKRKKKKNVAYARKSDAIVKVRSAGKFDRYESRGCNNGLCK